MKLLSICDGVRQSPFGKFYAAGPITDSTKKFTYQLSVSGARHGHALEEVTEQHDRSAQCVVVEEPNIVCDIEDVVMSLLRL